eukprot:Nitzschia sp. Nitz4//scaffold35_size145790//112690//113573//NITZ4_003048-RA/size145790-processed-gene-0.212-mRNA-1//1//CDS//3329549178//4278//frame0
MPGVEPNVSQINYQGLKDHCGIQAIVFDKDNTLTGPYENVIHEDAVEGLEAAQAVFGKDRVAILSNSAGTNDDANFEDAKKIEIALGVAVIRHQVKKPGGLNEVLAHFEIKDPETLCMVGDRLLTDIVFGNLYGMLTVHTLPLCKGSKNRRDNKIASFIRSIENAFLYGGWFNANWLGRKPPHKYWDGKEDRLTLKDTYASP